MRIGANCRKEVTLASLVVKYMQYPRERFLSEVEFRRLGRTLTKAEDGKGAPIHVISDWLPEK